MAAAGTERRAARRGGGPGFDIEHACAGPVCGVDEAGRGPLAGPVVAAAVILDPAWGPADLDGLDDSKRLTARARDRLFERLQTCASIGVGAAGVAEIESLNILNATFLAMHRAVAALPEPPATALIDGDRAPGLACATRTVIGGDGLSASIAAASVIAKVTRDRLMRALAAEHPAYGWERNAGYGTAEHLAALARHGATPHHRASFAPVRLVLERRGR